MQIQLCILLTSIQLPALGSTICTKPDGTETGGIVLTTHSH